MNRLEVREAVLDCERCSLHSLGSGPVAFSGPTPAEYAILGEAPGAQEEKKGVPFIGPAGELLRESLRNVRLDPEKAFISNSVSCNPKGTPSESQIRACTPNREMQLELSEAPFVLVLGSIASSTLIPDVRITQAHGQVLKEKGRVYFLTFHPAAALRKVEWKTLMQEDLVTFAELIHTDPTTNDWHRYSPCKCIVCGIPEEKMETEMFGENGLPYCERHWSNQ